MASRYIEFMEPQKKPGRPRCEQVHQAILDATKQMLVNTPIRDLTIEGIAKTAGVGKPTIYRWWPCKCTLVMEAFLDNELNNLAFPKNTTITKALQTHIAALVTTLSNQKGQTIADLIGEGQSQPKILERFRNLFFEQILGEARTAIDMAKQNGEIEQSLNTDIVLDMIYGPVYYRLLVGHEPLDKAFSQQLSNTVTRLITA